MYKVNQYPDGTTYVETDLDDNEVVRINSYQDLWTLRQLVDAKNNLGVIPEITIPNLLDAQADRRFSPDQSSGLKLVLEFMWDMNARFKIFHPHNPEVVEALLDNVDIMDNQHFMECVFERLNLFNNVVDGKRGDFNTVLISPDAGAFKPLTKLADGLKWRGETYSAAKARKFEDGQSKLHQIIDRQDFQGKDIIIVDDICVRGGTFLGLASLLRERNVGKLYLAVSHMTLEILKPELFQAYDKVFTTNSKYDNYFIPQRDGGVQHERLEVIELFNPTQDV